MPNEGEGPRSNVPLDELSGDLPVLVEIIGGDDLESGYVSLHDPDHLESTDAYEEMRLADALEIADDLCIDCFTRASLEFGREQMGDGG